MRGNHVTNNSAYKSKNPGALSGRIAQTLPYGEERKSAVDMAIGEIKKALIDFPNEVKNGKNWREKQYKEKKKGVVESGEIESSG